jgi:hypothetical protein
MDAEKQWTIWLDWMMLAKADCMVLSASGFGYVALWSSSTTCMVTMRECLKAAEKAFVAEPLMR